ncbi:MAG: RagB/SusD family nutrient uptake outer membrane protein, partial [Prevotella sp.]|nr:RagB/SusD family nutrient uptake outer membrane protein [Prevotella sp.]
MTAMTLSSCSDNFLEEKKNYDNVTPTEVYADYTGASARVNDIYAWCLPDANAEANWKYNCTGVKDEQSKSTEEFSGFTVFTNPQQEMSVANGNVPDYFQNTLNNIQA